MFTVIDNVYGSQLLCPILLLAPHKNLGVKIYHKKITVKNYACPSVEKFYEERQHNNSFTLNSISC